MIDTHQHLLYPEHFGYAWTKELPALDKAFHLADYREAAKDTPISGTLFMEVDVDDCHFPYGRNISKLASPNRPCAGQVTRC